MEWQAAGTRDLHITVERSSSRSSHVNSCVKHDSYGGERHNPRGSVPQTGVSMAFSTITDTAQERVGYCCSIVSSSQSRSRRAVDHGDKLASPMEASQPSFGQYVCDRGSSAWHTFTPRQCSSDVDQTRSVACQSTQDDMQSWCWLPLVHLCVERQDWDPDMRSHKWETSVWEPDETFPKTLMTSVKLETRTRILQSSSIQAILQTTQQ